MAAHNIAAVVLAAGGSTRFGPPKQLLPFRGKPLIRCLVEVAIQSKSKATYVVLGAQANKIQTELANLPATVVHNADWQEGIASSIRAGITAIPPDCTAALLLVIDQPFLTTALLDSIIDRHLATRAPVVACSYANTVGVPALFDRTLFPELLSLQGDRGAKRVILAHAEEAETIPWPDGAVDIDIVEDRSKLL